MERLPYEIRDGDQPDYDLRKKFLLSRVEAEIITKKRQVDRMGSTLAVSVLRNRYREMEDMITELKNNGFYEGSGTR